MSDDIATQIESGEADPSDFLNTRGEARQQNLTTGTATREDMRQGRVDPADVLDGTTMISGESSPQSGGDVTQMTALDYLKDETRSAYEAEAETGEVVVHLSGDESLDAEVEEWAEKHGVQTKGPQ